MGTFIPVFNFSVAVSGHRGGVVSTVVFGRPRLQISAQRVVILSEVFRGFLQFLQASFGPVLQIRPMLIIL
jgi:hypothetical protein